MSPASRAAASSRRFEDRPPGRVQRPVLDLADTSPVVDVVAVVLADIRPGEEEPVGVETLCALGASSVTATGFRCLRGACRS